MTKQNKPKQAGGRPKSLDGDLVLIAFKADARTVAALEKLCAAHVEEAQARGELANVNGSRACVIRRCIDAAARQLG